MWRMKEKNTLHIILLLALVLRLYHITFPVGGWHSWRQADTAAIAKNFYENGYNIFYPQIDWGGNSIGYVESEFQLYPFLVSVFYTITGVNDIWGRLFSILFSLATIYGLYLLVRKYISDKVALWSAFIYAILPFNIYFARAFMPESAMLMCTVWGIYWFSRWLDSSGTKYFVLSCLSITTAILLKIPALYLGLPLLFLAHLKYGKSLVKIKWLWLFALLVLLPVSIWYYHAHQIFIQTGLSFGIWGFGTDKWGNFNLILTPGFYNDIFLKSIAERHLTYTGFILLIIGLFIKRKGKEEKLFDYWLLAVLIYFLIVARGNQVHDYYQLPFVLPAVVFIGKTIVRGLAFAPFFKSIKIDPFKTSLVMICLLGILVQSYLRYDHLMKYESYNAPLFRLASSVKKNTTKNDLVIAVSNYDPVMLYRCRRKGWQCFPEQLDSAYLSNKVANGARFLIGETSMFNKEETLRIFNKLSIDYFAVKQDTNYFIFNIKKKHRK